MDRITAGDHSSCTSTPYPASFALPAGEMSRTASSPNASKPVFRISMPSRSSERGSRLPSRRRA
ncbi:hypothetical protein [Amycolatopsis sp. CA-230715]|uniref:hypothetical protein n=1 Tax=Amycolatopsis sp. CA-230715 TaxID=2745196 RepID=UPI001C00F3B6|nr:hypothetical protein [Amycolatopsis sp. CA-230715]